MLSLILQGRQVIESPVEEFDYWVKVPVKGGFRYAMADLAIVYSCFEGGTNLIVKEILRGNHTTQGLGEKLKCGTNCGSCIPELKALVKGHKAVPPLFKSQ